MKLKLRRVFGMLYSVAAITMPAQTFTTLASFNYTDGFHPDQALIQGTDGSRYGTTEGEVPAPAVPVSTSQGMAM
jgi:hypothetical protein